MCFSLLYFWVTQIIFRSLNNVYNLTIVINSVNFPFPIDVVDPREHYGDRPDPAEYDFEEDEE